MSGSSWSEIDFVRELEIIQEEIFSLPESSWDHLDALDIVEEETYVDMNSNSICLSDQLLQNVAHGGLMVQNQVRHPTNTNQQVEFSPSKEENIENNVPTCFRRFTIKKEGGISMQMNRQEGGISMHEVVKPSKQRRLKQIDRNVFVVSSETSSSSSNRRCRLNGDTSKFKQKRDVMNNAERLRRTEIADRFRDLSQMIPEQLIGKSSVGSGISKIRVLDSARDYCLRLQNNLKKTEDRLAEEKRRNCELAFSLKALQRSKYSFHSNLDDLKTYISEY